MPATCRLHAKKYTVTVSDMLDKNSMYHKGETTMKKPLIHPLYRSTALLLIMLMALGTALSGCASRGGRTYSDGEVRTAQRLETGTVVDVTAVMVEEDPSVVGPVLGGVAGGILGSMFGAGRGRTLAILGGAALGVAGGAAAEKGIRQYEASQITIELDNKQTLVVVQANDEYFTRGDRVRVIHTDAGRARVQHM